MLTNSRPVRIEWGDCDPAGDRLFPALLRDVRRLRLGAVPDEGLAEASDAARSAWSAAAMVTRGRIPRSVPLRRRRRDRQPRRAVAAIGSTSSIGSCVAMRSRWRAARRVCGSARTRAMPPASRRNRSRARSSRCSRRTLPALHQTDANVRTATLVSRMVTAELHRTSEWLFAREIEPVPSSTSVPRVVAGALAAGPSSMPTPFAAEEEIRLGSGPPEGERASQRRTPVIRL